MSAALGPRAVTIVYLGGPADGRPTTYNRGDGVMPTVMPSRPGGDIDGRYHLEPPAPLTPDVWRYRWHPTHSGRRQTCTARGALHPGCLGGRCPSGRSDVPF